MSTITWTPSPDRCFAPAPIGTAARELRAPRRTLPIVAPHSHVRPAFLADPTARLGTPAELAIIPVHYVVRMLYRQGDRAGRPRRTDLGGTPVATHRRRIWQRFAEHFHLFRGT